MDNAANRIIDANFNRAREALRVIEDYCRFVVNSKSLSARVKELRHQLCASIGKLDSGRLISSRDTLADVGVDQVVEGQHSREDLKDCLTAACKRVVEALRVLSEVVQIRDKSIARQIEQLRYAAYTLEKDIVLISEPLEKFKKVELYIIITSNFPSDILSLTAKCAASGAADCIQLRAKEMPRQGASTAGIPDDELYNVACEFVKICRDSGVYSVINDRIDIAIAADADGLHLGQNDLPVQCARKLAQKPVIIGKSTHSLDQLRSACQEQPTYVGLGPIHATTTKPSAEPVGLEYIRKATEFLKKEAVGHTAIGGITIDNIEKVLSAGADCIAVCNAVTKAVDPAVACKNLKEKIFAFKSKMAAANV
jgi:thiamine-phosphate pyrophosphorylase